MPRMTATATTASRETLASNLLRMLSEQGHGSRKRLAERIGVHPSQISQYLAGTENIGLNTLDTLAEALGCEPLDLLRPVDGEN